MAEEDTITMKSSGGIMLSDWHMQTLQGLTNTTQSKKQRGQSSSALLRVAVLADAGTSTGLCILRGPPVSGAVFPNFSSNYLSGNHGESRPVSQGVCIRFRTSSVKQWSVYTNGKIS